MRCFKMQKLILQTKLPTRNPKRTMNSIATRLLIVESKTLPRKDIFFFDVVLVVNIHTQCLLPHYPRLSRPSLLSVMSTIQSKCDNFFLAINKTITTSLHPHRLEITQTQTLPCLQRQYHCQHSLTG